MEHRPILLHQIHRSSDLVGICFELPLSLHRTVFADNKARTLRLYSAILSLRLANLTFASASVSTGFPLVLSFSRLLYDL